MAAYFADIEEFKPYHIELNKKRHFWISGEGNIGKSFWMIKNVLNLNLEDVYLINEYRFKFENYR